MNNVNTFGKFFLTAGLCLSVGLSAGCAKKKEEKSQRENLTNSEEIAWARGDWQSADKPQLGGQIRISTTDRTFKMDLAEDISERSGGKLPKGTNCRYRLSGANLEIFRKDGSVYNLEFRATDAVLVPSTVNNPLCPQFIEGAKQAFARGEGNFQFHFTKRTNEKTGEVMLSNLVAGGSLYRKRVGPIKTTAASCPNLSGGFASSSEVRQKRQHLYEQKDCLGYTYTDTSSSQPPTYFKADDKYEDVINTPDRVVSGKRQFTADRLERIEIDKRPRTNEEIATTSQFYLNDWSDLVEEAIIEERGKPARPFTEIRYRQSF